MVRIISGDSNDGRKGSERDQLFPSQRNRRVTRQASIHFAKVNLRNIIISQNHDSKSKTMKPKSFADNLSSLNRGAKAQLSWVPVVLK